jgi:hypothetical protein
MENRILNIAGWLYVANRIFCHLLYTLNEPILDHVFHIGDRTYQLLLFIALSLKGIRKYDRDFLYFLSVFSAVELLYYIAYATKLIPFISEKVSFRVTLLEFLLISIYFIIKKWKLA